MKKLNTNDVNDVNNTDINNTEVNNKDVYNCSQLINTMNNLNLNDKKSFPENGLSHLFISYPKNRRLEFQSCKPYDPDEIYFNKVIYNERIDRNNNITENNNMICDEYYSENINIDDDNVNIECDNTDDSDDDSDDSDTVMTFY
jgi:hypothetical protein